MINADVLVAGAGVFGSWIAFELRRRGRTVVLCDGYGPGNSRASSGGESRIIRMGYGKDEIYTRWAQRSLPRWKDLARLADDDTLLRQTGVLWLAREDDRHASASLAAFARLGVPHTRLDRQDMERLYPQMAFGDITWGILEPHGGVLLARQAVRDLVRLGFRMGIDYRSYRISPPSGPGPVRSLPSSNGEAVSAEHYVFACGPWLPKLFPVHVGERIHVTRQEEFFFGPPEGDVRYGPSHLPAWIDFGIGAYGVPDFDHRGVKVAFDRHGPPLDPDSDDRRASVQGGREIAQLVAMRFPGLVGAPLLETRVCQYENTANGDFLIDRHPDYSNVWLVGGGSGHGFKHGPAVAEYLVEMMYGKAAPEVRFALSSKQTVPQRAVY